MCNSKWHLSFIAYLLLTVTNWATFVWTTSFSYKICGREKEVTVQKNGKFNNGHKMEELTNFLHFIISSLADVMKSLYEDYHMCAQECIPVGCVPAAHWPYAGGYLLPGGGGILACTEAETPPTPYPPPPVNRITDTSKNITLVTTSLRPVNITKNSQN